MHRATFSELPNRAETGENVKRTHSTQTATSLPEAPLADTQSRMRRYLLMMGIRVACFVLMAVITPYGWYTWVFAAGAIFIPYFAVVLANVTSSDRPGAAEAPHALTAGPGTTAPIPAPTAPVVIRVDESSPHRDVSDQ